jgi:hypothetical protein
MRAASEPGGRGQSIVRFRACEGIRPSFEACSLLYKKLGRHGLRCDIPCRATRRARDVRFRPVVNLFRISRTQTVRAVIFRPSIAGPHGGAAFAESSSGSAIRLLVPSHRELLRSKAVAVSVAETPGQRFQQGRSRGERQQTASESGLADVKIGG